MAGSALVLVVDDERTLVGVIASHLDNEGLGVIEAYDGTTALVLARAERPDVVIVDLALPDIDGIDLIGQLREFTDAYVLVLTARDEESDKVAALNAGADDYVVKPFSARELIARVVAMLRRPRLAEEPSDRQVSLGDLRLDLDERQLHQGRREVHLTRTEFDLLRALASRPRVALTRRELIDEVWGADWYGDEQVVDVHMRAVRRKLLDSAADPRYIRTVRGVGYAAIGT
jgi:DNA-binding response OmpR family regulator